MESENKMKQMGTLVTSHVWLNLVDQLSTMIECKEHQQGLDHKLAPYTDNQSTQRQNPMMMSDDEIIIMIDDLCGWKCAMN